MNLAFDQYKNTLSEFVAFESVSTDAAYAEHMQKTVSWLKSYGESRGANVQTIELKEHNPLVVLKWEVPNPKETVLIYGHYDVQPVKAGDEWFGKPFSLTEIDGKLYARGVVDNKGQILTHLHTVSNLFETNLLTRNVIFLIEGNEESGNSELAGILHDYKDLFKSDKIMISDGQIIAGYPTIEMGLRGGGNLTVTLKTANSDLHSGIFGGAVPNASLELARIISELFSKTGKVLIDGFYDGVCEITDELRKNNLELENVDGQFKERAGVRKLLCEEGNDPYTQIGLRPTMQVTGIKTGYIEEGYSNIVPCFAEARLNVRLVANQNPEQIKEMLIQYFNKVAPEYCEISVKTENLKPAVKFNHNLDDLAKIRALLEKNYGKKSYLQYCGGSIPVVQTMQEVFNLDPLLISFGNDDCRMHGVNENFDIQLIKNALGFSYEYFSS